MASTHLVCCHALPFSIVPDAGGAKEAFICCNVAGRIPAARNLAVCILDVTYLCAIEAYGMTRMNQGSLGILVVSTVSPVFWLVLGPSSRSR